MAAENHHPPLLDLTIDNITPNVNRINSQSGNARLTYLMSRLVTHLHDFARETRLSNDEWMAALNFLVGCGQISSDVRHVRFLLAFSSQFSEQTRARV
jgi:Catechol dioxygenase N terminus